jgi:hypothetical protein
MVYTAAFRFFSSFFFSSGKKSNERSCSLSGFQFLDSIGEILHGLFELVHLGLQVCLGVGGSRRRFGLGPLFLGHFLEGRKERVSGENSEHREMGSFSSEEKKRK